MSKYSEATPGREGRRPRARTVAVACIALSILGFLVSFAACGSEEAAPRASAYRVTSRSQLIGGPTALGEVGDYMIENDQIRLVIQDLGYNRGSGLFGGSLIDADLVRSSNQGDPMGGNGRDTFGELFPAFFLEVIDPDEIVVVNDGSDGKAAILEVRGRGGEFITMLRFFNQAMVNSYEASMADLVAGKPATSDGEPLVEFATRYILEPGVRHVRIESRLRNVSPTPLDFPNQQIVLALKLYLPDIDFSQFFVPTGHVLGFGARNQIFAPGIGYDVRFGLEDAYQTQIDLPALPGHLTDLVASSGPGHLSYGFATAAAPESNFIFNKKEYYGDDVSDDQMLFLFYASGFGGVFTNQMPRRLAPYECEPGMTGYEACVSAQEEHPSEFVFTNYFILGNGDVASVRDELYRIRGLDTHIVQGRIRDEISGAAVDEGVRLLVYEARPGIDDAARSCRTEGDEAPVIFNAAETNSAGYFNFQLTAGRYCYRVVGEGRPLSDAVPFEVKRGGVMLAPVARAYGTIEATVTNAAGTPVPAKMTVVGTYTPEAGKTARDQIFDLSAGESWRTGEFAIYDEDDLSPRRYIEAIAFASADGRFSTRVRPGKYTVYFSRGTEYEVASREIEVLPGGRARATGKLVRSVRPGQYVSGDFHLHAAGSIDSGLDYDTRVISAAAEGLDVVVATDHNYISDYAPYIYRNGLTPWLKSIIGLELTTFEAGHFNAFPLERDIASMNRGSMAWQDVPPQQIFDALRAAGSLGPERTIIQVNHPRDSILGYFSQHNLDPFTTVPDLKFNTASGLDRLMALLASPTGPAFIETRTEGGRTTYHSTFSWDFDAIEIYNGKRIELLRHFRMPYEPDELPDHVREQLTDEEIAALPPKGTIMCNKNEVAFPGVLDDWYTMLNTSRPDGTYRKYTGTGNSDSHKAGTAGDPEPGYPRNYFFVGHNTPERVTDAQLADAMLSHHNIVTNGPFVTMHINEQPVGSTVVTTGDQVAVTIRVQTASWVGADRYRLIGNGEVVHEGTITLEDGRWEETIAVAVERDTWFVLEVEGDNNLFPVVMPEDQGAINIEAAIGSIAGAFGFGGGVEGLAPEERAEVRPFAFTNPIWVVRPEPGSNRTEFEPLNPTPGRCRAGQFQPGGLMHWDAIDLGAERRMDAFNLPVPLHTHAPTILDRTKGQVRDVRLLFEAFGHGH